MLCKDDSQEMSNEETNTSSSHQQGAEDVCVCVSPPGNPVVTEQGPVMQHICLCYSDVVNSVVQASPSYTLTLPGCLRV